MAISSIDIWILFTNYDIIKYFLNLAFCSEHFISIKYQILCYFCLIETNSIIDYIWECTISKLYWESFNDWLSNTFHIVPIHINVQSALLWMSNKINSLIPFLGVFLSEIIYMYIVVSGVVIDHSSRWVIAV